MRQKVGESHQFLSFDPNVKDLLAESRRISRNYANSIRVYEERVDVARGIYDRSSAAYVNRFGEEYSPLSDLYRAFEEEKKSPEFDVEQRIKDLSADDFSFKILGLLFIGLLVLLLFALEYVVANVKHYFFNGMLL